MQLWDWDRNRAHERMQGLVCMHKYIVLTTPSGLYIGFLPRGGEHGVCQKEGGEAVRSCRAAAGGGCRRGMCPLPHKIFTSLRSIYMSCDML